MCSITIGEYDFEFDEFSCVSDTAKKLVVKLLKKKPSERPAVENCMHDEFIESHIQQGEIKNKPDRRLSMNVRDNIAKYNALRKWKRGLCKVKALTSLTSKLRVGPKPFSTPKTACEAIRRLTNLDSGILFEEGEADK